MLPLFAVCLRPRCLQLPIQGLSLLPRLRLQRNSTASSNSQPRTRAKATLKRWTSQEKAKVVELVSEGLSPRELQQHFPDRSFGAVRERFKRLYKDYVTSITAGRHDPASLPRPILQRPTKKWTSEETSELVRLLPQLSHGLSVKQLLPFFPDRSHQSLKCRIDLLLHLQAISRNSSDQNPAIESLPESTSGLSKPRNLSYTEEENELLRKLWNSKLSFEEIMAHFPQRTRTALRQQANKMGLGHRPLCTRKPRDGTRNGRRFENAVSQLASWARSSFSGR